MLSADGFTEAFIREQTLEWVSFAQFQLDRRYRLRLANEMTVLAHAVAASASEAGADGFLEVTQQLRGPDDEEIAYLTDPNAQADVDAVAVFSQQQSDAPVSPAGAAPVPPPGWAPPPGMFHPAGQPPAPPPAKENPDA